MQQALTLDVCIPAFNEENNIYGLVSSLLEQTLPSQVRLWIHILSDGSSDNTVASLKSLNSEQVKVHDFPDRKGKSARLNEFFAFSNADIVAVLDADILVESKDLLANLVLPFIQDPKTALVSGKAEPMQTQNFWERVANISVEMISKARSLHPNTEMYTCEGTVRAFSKELYKNITFPLHSGDDVYPYLYCKSHRLGYHFAKDAIVRYFLPSTFKDYFKQQIRFNVSQQIQSASFSKTEVQNSFTISIKDKLKALVLIFRAKPVATLTFIFTAVLVRLAILTRKDFTVGTWPIALSTKRSIL